MHIITAIFCILTVLSYVVRPAWIQGGKGKLADFQRSGILTLVLAAIAFVFEIITFACIFTIVVNGKSALNAIDGISASWPGSAAFWVSVLIFHSLFLCSFFSHFVSISVYLCGVFADFV